MSEVHAKLYLYSYKGGVKEIRRLGLHLMPNWLNWASVMSAIQGLFTVDGITVTYEDPEKDRVNIDSQDEWAECLRLGSYNIANPLRLHIKKHFPKESRAKPKDAVILEPIYAYTSDGNNCNIPENIDQIKELLPNIIKKLLVDNKLPDWLQPAVKVLQSPEGGVDFDVNVQLLANCLSEHALKMMADSSRNYAASLELFQEACSINPCDEKLLYNMACCLALMGQSDESLNALELAINLGFNDYQHLMQDDDLKSLRENSRFTSLSTRIMVPEGKSVILLPQEEPMAAIEAQVEEGMKHIENLQKLKLMGFLDDAASIKALEEADGSIPRAIDILLHQ